MEIPHLLGYSCCRYFKSRSALIWYCNSIAYHLLSNEPIGLFHLISYFVFEHQSTHDTIITHYGPKELPVVPK